MYEKMKEDHFQLDPDFIEIRKKTSSWLERLMQDLNILPQTSQILSIGAGLGLVEIPLINKGYNITLQEHQDQSFFYIKKALPQVQLKFLCTKDVSDVSKNMYDFIYAYGVFCVIDMKYLSSFMKNIYQILKPGGCFAIISGDGAYSWDLLKTLFVKHQGVLWGWKRPWQLTAWYAKKVGFTLEAHYFLNGSLERENPSKILGIPIKYSPLQDYFLFRKP